MLCPACEYESENTQQCTNCGWQFVYFIQEPSEQEQNEYTLLLQNYRTELYFNLAQHYYQNKQYEETVQCCFISCEHQIYENPLALLALAYKELENYDETLKYANMAIKLNPSNEIALKLLSEFSYSVQVPKKTIQSTDEDTFKTTKQKENTATKQKENTATKQKENAAIEENIKVRILTDKILTRDTFEKTHEFQERIKKLNWLRIGSVSFSNYEAYDADNEIFTFKINLNTYNKFRIKDSNLLEEEIKYKISPEKAKELLASSMSIEILAKVTISSSDIYINDLLMCKMDRFATIFLSTDSYNLMNILNERKEAKIEQERQLEEKRKDREYNKLSFFEQIFTDKNSL